MVKFMASKSSGSATPLKVHVLFPDKQEACLHFNMSVKTFFTIASVFFLSGGVGLNVYSFSVNTGVNYFFLLQITIIHPIVYF